MEHTPITYTVLIDWDRDGFGPGDDITAYMKTNRHSSGILDNTSRVAAVGGCQILLNNTDRRFSPANSASPLYGKLKPGLPIQLSVTDGVDTWVVWTGYTQAFTPEPGTQGRRTCLVSGFDPLALYQNTTIALPLQENQTTDAIIQQVINQVYQAPVASQTILALGLPANGDTLTINGGGITFKSALTGGSSEVLITAGDSNTTADHFAACINHAAGVNSTYGALGFNPGVSASVVHGGRTTNPNSTPGMYFHIGTVSGTDWQSTQKITLGVGGPIAQIWYYLLANAGSPTGTITWELCEDSGGAVGAVVRTGAVSPVASSWNSIFLDGSLIAEAGAVYWLRLRSTTMQPGATNCWLWACLAPGGYPDGILESHDGGANWTSYAYSCVFEVDTAPVITLLALVRGSVGNAITLANTGTALALGGATLTGGDDAPVGNLPTLDAGFITLAVSGDSWDSDTNGLTALSELADTEQGFIWVSRWGTLVFKNKDFVFQLPTQTPAMVIDGEASLTGDLTLDDIYTKVIAHYSPRQELATGVVAQANNTITVPGQSGTERWNGTVVLPGGGNIVVKLPFTNPANGERMAAKNIVLPLVPNTDFKVWENANATGWDYTTSSVISFSVASNGTDAEISIKNTALGPLYVTMLKIRGTGIVSYQETQYVAEDAAAESEYGVRALDVVLPLAVPDSFAQAVAWFLLEQTKSPRYQISRIYFDSGNVIDGLNVYALEIGDLLKVSDDQTGVVDQLVIVTGLAYTYSGHNLYTVQATVRPLAQTVYGILDSPDYCILDVNARLSL